jgi:WD40 repeat protein/tetratricopeptide (TPR) repeat protein
LLGLRGTCPHDRHDCYVSNSASFNDDPERSHRIAHLIAEHFRRRRAGATDSDEALIAAHPDLAPHLANALRMAPLLLGLSDSLDDGRQGKTETFGFAKSDTRRGHLEVRCPSCSTPIEVAVDTQLTDLTCSSCGSHFSLIDREQTTHMAPTLTTMGRFDLIERIGVGGFGTVWKARDKELDRTVAVKVPRRGGMTPEETEKFFREARAAAQLRHPNIVSVHEVGRDGDSVFIVSDFVRGVTLGDWLTGQQLTSREAAELCAKIADALHHAHEKGVVHRDLKPGNVMIDGDGEPHIMDFGLARREAGEVTVTVDGQILGTPAYMSPEQATGESHTADRRSDVYSLGVILFQLLTGELPFRGNPRMLLHQVINDEPPSPRKLNSSVSRDLETITLKCLEKSPAKRYEHSADVAADLRRWMTNKPIAARPVAWPERGWRWVRRNPAVAGLALVIVTSLLTFTGLTLRSSSAIRQENARTQAALNDVERARKDAESAAERTQQMLYSTSMNVAARGWESGSIRRLLMTLAEQCPQPGDPDLRDFQWRSLWRNCAPYATSTILRSDAPVQAAAYSSDGQWLACGLSDGSVVIWRPESEEFVRRIKSGADAITRLAFQPNSTRVAALASDGVVRLWDASTGDLTASTADSATQLTALAVSPLTGEFITGDAQGQLRLWDANGRPSSVEFGKYDSGVVALAWSNDGRIVAASYLDLKAVVWDAKTGARALAEPLQGGPDNYGALALSPDGKLLAIGAYQRFHLWDVSTGKYVRLTYCHPNNTLDSIAFSPNGQTLATTGGDGAIAIHSVTQDNILRLLKGHAGGVFSIAFSPDGLRLVSGGEDGSTVLWDAPALTDADEWTASVEPVAALACSPSESIIVTGSSVGDATVWNADDGSLTSRINKAHGSSAPISQIAFFAEGKRFATMGGDGAVRVWDAASLAQLQEIRREPIASSAAMDVDPVGRFVAFQVGLNALQICDLTTGNTLHELSGHSDKVHKIRVDPKGKTLISVGRVQPTGGEAFLWDADTGKQIASHIEPRAEIVSAAISPRGETIVLGLALTNGIAEILVCDAADLKVRTRLVADSQVTALGFSPDGRTFVSACSDGIVRCWSASNFADEGALAKVQAPPLALSFDRTGDILAVGLADGTIQMIRAAHWGDDSSASQAALATLPRPMERWPLDSGSEETVAFYQSLLEENRGKLGPDHPTTIQSELLLSAIYAKRNVANWSKGYRATLARLGKTLGAKHRDVLRATFDLGQIYEEKRRPVLAARYYEACLPEQRVTLGASHRETIASLEALAKAYGEIGRRDDQLLLQEELLKAKQTLLGESSLESVLAEKALIDGFTAQGKFALAAPHWRHRIETLSREREPGQDDLVNALRDYSELLRRDGQFDEAARTLRQLLEQRPDDWEARSSLSEAYAAAGNVEAAQKFLTNVLKDVDEKQLAPEPLFHLGSVYFWAGDAAKALELLKRATAEPKPFAASAWTLLAKAAAKSKQTDEAIAAWRKSFELAAAEFGPTSEQVTQQRRELLAACFEAARDDDAIAALPPDEGSPWNGRWAYFDAIELAEKNSRSAAVGRLVSVLSDWGKRDLTDDPSQFASLLVTSAEQLNIRRSWEPSQQFGRAAVEATLALFGDDHSQTRRARTVLEASTAHRLAAEPRANLSAIALQPPIHELFEAVGQKRTVVLTVQATGGNNNLYVNSLSDFRRKDCFTVRLTPIALTELSALGVKDPWRELLGRSVEATGIVQESAEGQLSIVVENVAQQFKFK